MFVHAFGVSQARHELFDLPPEREELTLSFAIGTALANGSDSWTGFSVWRERTRLSDEQRARP